MVKRRTRKKKTTKEYKERKFDFTSIIFAVIIVVIIALVIWYAFNKIKSSTPSDIAGDTEQIDTTANQPVEQEPPPSEQEAEQKILQIEILNGCGVRRLVARIADMMRQDGFDVVNTDNYKEDNRIRFTIQNSFILDRVGNEANAKRIADAIGIDHSNIRTDVSPDLMLDATIVIGHDYKQLKYFRE